MLLARDEGQLFPGLSGVLSISHRFPHPSDQAHGTLPRRCSAVRKMQHMRSPACKPKRQPTLTRRCKDYRLARLLPAEDAEALATFQDQHRTQGLHSETVPELRNRQGWRRQAGPCKLTLESEEEPAFCSGGASACRARRRAPWRTRRTCKQEPRCHCFVQFLPRRPRVAMPCAHGSLGMPLDWRTCYERKLYQSITLRDPH